MFVEATRMGGEGKLTLTGQLGMCLIYIYLRLFLKVLFENYTKQLVSRFNGSALKFVRLCRPHDQDGKGYYIYKKEKDICSKIVCCYNQQSFLYEYNVCVNL